MSESVVLSSSGMDSKSSARQFNVLNLRDYYNVMQEFSQNMKLSDLMQTTFQIKYDLTRGLQSDELKELIGSDRQCNGNSLVEELKKLSNGHSTCLAMSPTDSKGSETNVIFGQMFDNKFDVLDIQVIQTTEIDKQKLAAVTVGAACAGVVAGMIATPVVGILATSAILGSAGLKIMYDQQMSQSNLLFGYIFKQLNDKRVIRLEDGNVFIS